MVRFGAAIPAAMANCGHINQRVKQHKMPKAQKAKTAPATAMATWHTAAATFTPAAYTSACAAWLAANPGQKHAPLLPKCGQAVPLHMVTTLTAWLAANPGATFKATGTASVWGAQCRTAQGPRAQCLAALGAPCINAANSGTQARYTAWCAANGFKNPALVVAYRAFVTRNQLGTAMAELVAGLHFNAITLAA
jgi:hypothetical protein